MSREYLKIIERKSKVHQSRAKAVVAKVSTCYSTPVISSEVAELKDMVRALLLDKKNNPQLQFHLLLLLQLKQLSQIVLLAVVLTRTKIVLLQAKTFIETTSKTLIGNKEKLSEMARTSMNEHCSAVILNKLQRKLRDPSKFLIPCEFLGMDECLALVDLGASINLMSLFMWEALSLPELTPTCMTLELVDRSVSKLIGIAKDVSFKVAITYNLDQTVRYSTNYNQMTANKIDVIEMACEQYTQEVLGFSDVTTSGNPTPHDDPIVSTTSPTLTPFRDNDFLLFEEADAFLGLEDDPNSPKINPFYYDPEGDILLLEAILNSEPLPPFPNHEQYMPSLVCEAKTVKSSIDEPLEVELKDLPPHLEYTFLEGDNKLPIIITKELGDEEKSALIKVLKSHKRPSLGNYLTYRKEVEKLLDAGLIYSISDSPWVSPVHCVPKKGGFTIVENEENELIPTRLVTVWRVCIDYRKINEAARKDHFPLPSMDQMLERFTGNEYYCFLDGFFVYFQIPIDPRDLEKTTCMLAIFHDMVEKTMEVFMDDFSVFGNSFKNCLSHLDKMLQRCKDTNLSLNWEKSHFMVKEGIVLGHKISKNGIEVDRAKVDVIAKLPHPTTVKEFFQNVFPTSKGYKLPPSYYAIKKIFKMIKLGWKDNNTSGKKVPKKVLCYFMIIPRLQHLYKSSHTAKEMIWHATRKCTKPVLKSTRTGPSSQILQRHIEKDPGVSASSELFALAYGPTPTPISVNSCIVNGVRFVVHSRGEHRTTQNIGIFLPSEKDEEMYYGQLDEILEFLYISFKVVLFRVKWFDTRNEGSKAKCFVIRNNMTQIWANRVSFKDDQYILATQVKQVFNLKIWPDDHPTGRSSKIWSIIDVDKDNDIIDDEDALPHDLADSDDKDLVNVDADIDVAIVYSSEEED
nr:reverse transcriptase domain-containing protein [Tanacetum cinerariifolium]